MAINIVGAITGTYFVTQVEAAILSKLVAVVLVVVIIVILVNKEDITRQRRPKKSWPFVYFLSTFFGGAVGAGTGILASLTLMHLRGFNALQALAHTFYSNLIGALFSIAILLFTDLIDYRYSLCLIIGNAIGSHFGSLIALKKGHKFVHYMIIIIAITAIAQLALL